MRNVKNSGIKNPNRNLYGLPKIHKTDAMITPIIFAVKIHNYHLAKYLEEILKPLVDERHMLKDLSIFDFEKYVLLYVSNPNYISFKLVLTLNHC